MSSVRQEPVVIDVEALYRAVGETARLEHLPMYESRARELER